MGVRGKQMPGKQVPGKQVFAVFARRPLSGILGPTFCCVKSGVARGAAGALAGSL